MRTERGSVATRSVPGSASGKSISAFPGATAMVWPGVGQAHEAVAVPGVRLEPGDAIVAVELATACDADLRTVAGQRAESAPAILGHEQVGRVIALGQGGAKSVDGRRLSIGARVVWSVSVPCGRCAPCRRGAQHLCSSPQRYGHARVRRGWELSGGFATHVHVLAGTPIVVVPEDVPAAVLAPASCAGATALAALDAASTVAPLAGSIVVIAGAGMLGLTLCAMATDAGARVIVADPDPVSRAHAAAFGAAAVADPDSVTSARSVAGTVTRLSGRHSSCSVVIDTVGPERDASALSQPGSRAQWSMRPTLAETARYRELTRSLEPGGALVLTGSPDQFAEVAPDAGDLVRRALTVRGVHDYTADQLQRAVDYLTEAGSRWPFADAVAQIAPLHDVDAALAAARQPGVARVAVDPRLRH